MINGLIIYAMLIRLAGIFSDSQDISGTWTGRLLQDPGGTRTEYDFRMELTQTRNEVNGFTYINHPDEKHIFGKIKLKGTIAKGVFNFAESTVENQNVNQNMYWCIKSGKLNLFASGKSLKMQGNWAASGCPPGTIELTQISKKITKR